MATATTTAGEVEGAETAGVHAFLGIPYAEPPVGSRRFRAPERRSSWDGVRDATAIGPVVPQSEMVGPLARMFVPRGAAGEDCLNLNVWTPDPGAAKLPVLVWIHGGGFQIGAGSEPHVAGTAFARDGVVLVTFNYRLGAQGYLYVEGAEGAGNFATLDQLMALEWIQENIAAFGGDPANVTIAGESSGAMCVTALMAAPRARGLFRRAVAQSGAAHDGVSLATARAVAACVGEVAGVDATDAEALRALPLDALLAAEQDVANRSLARAESRLGEELMGRPLAMAFQPAYGTELLPQRPIDAVQAGAAAGVELLIGTTTEEMGPLLRVAPEQYGIEPGEDLPAAIVEGTAQLAFGAAADAALAHYRRLHPGGSNFRLMAELFGDWAFRVPSERLADAQSAHAPVHAFELAWESPGAEGRWGAGHVLDIPLVFDTCETDVGEYLTAGAAPAELVAAMHGAWVAFATDGDPGWPAYDPQRRATMRFDAHSTLVEDPAREQHAIWDGVV